MSHNRIQTGLNFDASFVNQLDGFFKVSKGDISSAPKLIKANFELMQQLGFNLDELSDQDLAELFSGSKAALGSEPVAQAYAGHQFAGFSPILGDGRAVLLGEVIDTQGNRKDIHLKGSGITEFSRGGDGKAALGPVLREYLLGEAMNALNIPSTRALAAVLTGEQVMREQMLEGAVIARVASSHIRVGSYQLYAAQGKFEKVKQLADYTISRHFPELKSLENPYLGLLQEVRNRQAELIAKWNLVGFVHGVMNTDNVLVSGETIDYGPCAFIDAYDPAAVYSSIDRKGRYALGNQAYIGQWNLARFAETLLPFIDQDTDSAIEKATQEIQDFAGVYQAYWLQGVLKKLGINEVKEADFELATNLFNLLESQAVDFTNFFRKLSQASFDHPESVHKLFENPEKYDLWHRQWIQRLEQDDQSAEQRITLMNSVNPIYIPRNHLVEEALAAADNQNYQVFETLLEVLSHPFEEKEGLEKYTQAAPKEFGPYKTFCGT